MGRQKKKAALRLSGQTPDLCGCLSCFQLYPFIVEEMDIFVNDLLDLLEGQEGEMTERLLFEMSKEVFHRGIVPAVCPARHGGSNVILLGKGKVRL